MGTSRKRTIGCGRSDELQFSDLPDPRRRPDADVVIYDGRCPVCTRSAALLDRLDRDGRLAFLPLQDERVRHRWPDLSHEDLMRQVHVITAGGRRHRGAGAIRYLARRLPALWPTAPLLHVPGSMPLWRWLYRQVSRRRYWLGRYPPPCSSEPESKSCD